MSKRGRLVKNRILITVPGFHLFSSFSALSKAQPVFLHKAIFFRSLILLFRRFAAAGRTKKSYRKNSISKLTIRAGIDEQVFSANLLAAMKNFGAGSNHLQETKSSIYTSVQQFFFLKNVSAIIL